MPAYGLSRCQHLGNPELESTRLALQPGSAERGVKSVGVFPAYASSRGHALVDRELYLPRRWTDDLALCAEAGVPDQFPFRTKPQLTQAMLERAVTAGVTAGWVTGDTI